MKKTSSTTKDYIDSLNLTVNFADHCDKVYQNNSSSKFFWYSDRFHPFSDQDCHRLWYMKKSGGANVSTTFGKFPLEEGYYYFIPANTLLETYCESDMDQYYIHFIENPPMPFLFSALFKEYKIPATADTLDKFITIVENHDKTNLEIIIKTKGFLYELLAPFFRNSHLTNPKIMEFAKIFTYINDNFNNPTISLAELAKIQNYTKIYFCNLFKKLFNISPMKYIEQKRMQFSKQLLLQSTKNITEVAEASGYTDPLYFSRIFKQFFSVSPQQLRKAFKESQFS